MKIVELPPYAPTLIESTRAIGYSLETAIAHVVDNSVAANAQTISIDFFPVGEEYISIFDDGNGMDENELMLAMQYGSKSPNEIRAESDLGRFGLGLKTASLSQCRKLSVITKNSGKIYGARWDIDYVSQTGSWSLILLDDSEIISLPQIEKLYSSQSGTLVVWQVLDRLKLGTSNFEKSMGRKMDDVRNHLSLVFHRYLQGETNLKKINIYINEDLLIPIDPFLSQKSTKVMEKEVLIIEGEKVCVQPYLLPHPSKLTKQEVDLLGGKDGLRRQQGFYIYRNKRLLVWGTWFKMMRKGENSKLARIMVDIPNTLDHLWTLDIKKSVAIPPDEVKINLNNVIKNVADKSKNTWTFRGKKEICDNIVHIWDRNKTTTGGFVYRINTDHPIVKTIIKDNPDIERDIKKIFEYIESELPLNRIYLDLTGDEKIENDTLNNKEIVLNTFNNMVKGISKDNRESYIKDMMSVEPFSNYKEEIKNIYL